MHHSFGTRKLAVVYKSADGRGTLWTSSKDKRCYLLNKMNVKKELQCAGMLILHADDILVSGDQSDFYKKALQQLRATFDFGKWDVLSKNSPIKYCGGVVMMKEDGKI